MDINKQVRFVFKKPYKSKAGEIPVNSQIDVTHGTFYFNGGMCDTYSSQLFEYLINNKSLCNEYLREIPIPVNKI